MPCSPLKARVSGPGRGGDPRRFISPGAQIRSGAPVRAFSPVPAHARHTGACAGFTPPRAQSQQPASAGRTYGSSLFNQWSKSPGRGLGSGAVSQPPAPEGAGRTYGSSKFSQYQASRRQSSSISPFQPAPRARVETSRSPAVRALSFEPASSAAVGRAQTRDKRKAASVREEGIGGVCDESSASLVTLRHDPLRTALEKGKRLKTTDFLMDKLIAATNRLAKSMPEDQLIDMMEEKKEDYLALDPAEVLKWLQQEALEGYWNPAEIVAFIVATAYVTRWLSERDLFEGDGDLGAVPTWRITACLREYRDDKRTNFAKKNEIARARIAAAPGAPPVRAGHTGASSGQYFLRGLKFGRSKLKSPIKTEKINLSHSLDGGRKEPPRPAASTTLFVVTALEAFLVKGGVGRVQRHLAAAYLFLCYACMRCKQSTDCWITAVVGDEFVEGFVACEKNPRRGKRMPRPWWAPLYGATNSRLWLDTLLDTLQDVKDDCYIFRGFFSPDGSVLNATDLAPGPLQCGHQLAKAMQQILQLACGWTIPQAAVFSEHSPRHFLNEVARARGEPPACRQEIGRWSFSVAQMACMRPISGAVRAHLAAIRAMPDRYSQEAEKRRPLVILRRQMAAVRELVHQSGSDLPEQDGWHLLQHFVAEGGEFEE